MMKKILILSLCFVAIACQQNQETEPETDENPIQKIIVQFFPSFDANSMIIWDNAREELVFQRMTSKEYFTWEPYPTPPKKNMAPLSQNIKIDSASTAYLRDSVLFDESDFKDAHVEILDGILNSFLFINQDGSFQDIEINDVTKNQHKFIIRSLNLLIEAQNDSLSKAYLTALKSYY